MRLSEFYAEQHNLPIKEELIVKKGVRVIPESIFGILVLAYNVFAIDEEDKEIVVVVYSDYLRKLGVIYNTDIEEVTLELIEKTCSYEYTIE